MKKKYKGLVISDIHVGSMDLIKSRQEFSEMFIHHIKNMKELDFVIVDGDFFDRKFYLGDTESIVAHAMLKELIEACKEKKAVLRFVYGTEFHEANQYDVLSLMKLYDKVDVVKYVKEEELLPGLNVLYIPEEHISSKNEYYKDYFKQEKKYDYVFGHGIIREVMKEVALQIEDQDLKTSNKRKKVPVFSTGELSRICKGQVFFGHYHINENIDDKVFYVGSFSRWKFGEEEPKGFYELTYNTDKNTYKAEFIENSMATIYKTISYGYDNKIFQSEDELQSTLNSVDNMIDKKIFNHVRFMFNIPNNIENPEATINYLKERYKFKDKVKVEIVHGYTEERKKRQKEEIDSKHKKYIFLFDKSLPLEEKVSRFISIEYDKNISSDIVSKYMYQPLNEILDEK